jgi:uroporphyrin-3 C-methyltransferase
VSDQEKKNIEQVVQEAETSAAASAEAAASVEEPEPHVVVSPTSAQPQKKPDPGPRKGSSFIAWLALLLVLALAGGAGWSVLEMQRREAVLVDRVAELEGIAQQKDSSLEQVTDKWQTQLKTGLGKLQDELGGEAARQAQALQGVEALLAEQRAELARFSATDRESWLLAEAEYLLRLANQRLIMAGDTVAAQALLSSADDILRELDDVGLHDVRGAVTADLAAVRAVPRIDVEGIYLRLGALVEQADNLVIFQMPEQEARLRAEAAQNWQGRLQQGYENALAKLSDYIIIRRRDVPMQALMDPQWEGLVRQNMRMLLEQGQVALLSGNQSLYKESLQRALHWVGEFFESDESAARAMAREINQLIDLNVAATMPNISRSLRALDDAIEQRLQPGGSE